MGGSPPGWAGAWPSTCSTTGRRRASFMSADMDGDGKPEMWFQDTYAAAFTVRFSSTGYAATGTYQAPSYGAIFL